MLCSVCSLPRLRLLGSQFARPRFALSAVCLVRGLVRLHFPCLHFTSSAVYPARGLLVYSLLRLHFTSLTVRPLQFAVSAIYPVRALPHRGSPRSRSAPPALYLVRGLPVHSFPCLYPPYPHFTPSAGCFAHGLPVYGLPRLQPALPTLVPSNFASHTVALATSPRG